MAAFLFRHGFSYAAGIDKPFVLSESTIVEAVADLGFRVLFADECDRMPRFPFRVPGGCGDEWDWVGYAERTGPTKRLDVPDRVKWIQEIPKSQPVALPPPGEQPKPGPAPAPSAPLPAPWKNPENSPLKWFAPAALGAVAGFAAAWWWGKR